MEGVAKSVDEPERAYRGYIAVDDVSLQPMAEAGGTEGACHGMSNEVVLHVVHLLCPTSPMMHGTLYLLPVNFSSLSFKCLEKWKRPLSSLRCHILFIEDGKCRKFMIQEVNGRESSES